MTGSVQVSPPLPGNWEAGVVTRTGPWTVGTLCVDWDSCRYAMRVEEHHCNAMDMMHGGAMATFLDGQAFILRLPESANHTPTISLSVDFLAPPKVGDWLVATVEHVKTTRSMIVTQALARVGDRVVARSNAIYSNTSGKDAR
ncbi:MAG: PaaI family thioesterase [Novosphingobium sp.]|nr:PaaI family thioesterase [Novosphingobium sp.]